MAHLEKLVVRVSIDREVEGLILQRSLYLQVTRHSHSGLEIVFSSTPLTISGCVRSTTKLFMHRPNYT